MLNQKDINNLKMGDRSAQEKAYKFYGPKLKSVCLRYSQTVFDAEDIFQEAFVKIFSKIDKYTYDLSFDSWVRRIVVNTAIDFYKRNLKFASHKNYEEVNEEYLSPVDMPDHLSTEELLEIIQKLPEGYRLIFNMYEIEGYSHKEIAGMLNIAEGTSKSQLFKAKKFMQNLFHKNNILEYESKRI
jgi:RNA polymerase sigma factor (sigma-70 family)